MPGALLSLPEREEVSVALIEDRSTSWAEMGRRVGRHGPLWPVTSKPTGAATSIEWLVVGYAVTDSGDPRCELADVIDDEGGVCLGRWMERGVDPKVDLQVPILGPAAAALGEVRRLGHLLDAEESLVERDRLLLAPGRHRQLNMVESEHWHGDIMSR